MRGNLLGFSCKILCLFMFLQSKKLLAVSSSFEYFLTWFFKSTPHLKTTEKMNFTLYKRPFFSFEDLGIKITTFEFCRFLKGLSFRKSYNLLSSSDCWKFRVFIHTVFRMWINHTICKSLIFTTGSRTKITAKMDNFKMYILLLYLPNFD